VSVTFDPSVGHGQELAVALSAVLLDVLAVDQLFLP